MEGSVHSRDQEPLGGTQATVDKFYQLKLDQGCEVELRGMVNWPTTNIDKLEGIMRWVQKKNFPDFTIYSEDSQLSQRKLIQSYLREWRQLWSLGELEPERSS